MLTPRECAAQALDLIRDPAHWTTGVHARSQADLHRGSSVVPTDPKATCWCAEGAIAKVAGYDPWSEEESEAFHLYGDTMRFVCWATPGEGALCHTNDKLGHAAVIDRFERALASPA